MAFHRLLRRTLPWLWEPDWSMSQRRPWATCGLLYCQLIQPAVTSVVTPTVSAAICGHRSGPQVTKGTFSWFSEGRIVPDKVISERSSLSDMISEVRELMSWNLKWAVPTCSKPQQGLFDYFSQLSKQNACTGCCRLDPLRLTVSRWKGTTPSRPPLFQPPPTALKWWQIVHKQHKPPCDKHCDLPPKEIATKRVLLSLLGCFVAFRTSGWTFFCDGHFENAGNEDSQSGARTNSWQGT